MKYPQITNDHKTWQNGPYRIEQLNENVYAIDTDAWESIYLILGTEKAMVVDTGMRKEALLPVIQSITSLPLLLVLTHAHADHMRHADEFPEVFLHEADKAAWFHGLSLMVRISSLDPKHDQWHMKKYKAMNEETVFDLGDRKISVIHCKGHTPGSCILVDETDRMLFTGDAFGSGSYAWMWMPFCSGAVEYGKSLKRTVRKLQPYASYQFLGGHRMQSFPSDLLPNAHKLDLATVYDMIHLCNLLHCGKVPSSKREKQFNLVWTDYYEYGKAAVVYRKKQL